MHINILLVFIIPKQGLRVFPTVKASNSDIREFGARHDTLETFTLTVAEVGSLDVGRLDLSAMVEDDSVLVDEGLRRDRRDE